MASLQNYKEDVAVPQRFWMVDPDGTQHLITLLQLQALVGGGTIGNPSNAEVPAGLIDGANDTFVLAHTPINASLVLFWNNGFCSPLPGGDYLIVNDTITMQPGSVPQVGDTLIAYYFY